MKLTIAAEWPAAPDSIVILVASGDPISAAVDTLSVVQDAAQINRFSGDASSAFECFVPVQGKTVRLLVVGIGSGSSTDLEKAGGTISARLMRSGAKSIAVDAARLDAQGIESLSVGLRLRAWVMDRYRTKKSESQRVTLENVVLVSTLDSATKALSAADAIVEGVSFTRDLVAEPANVLYPESFVDRCRSLADLGIEVSILDEKDMAALGMGALLGVAQGSVRPPRLLALRWDGTGGAQAKPVAFVGKGVTFDTGGISIKPAAGMEDMKWDMGGAGAVAGLMKTLALRKAKAHVVGICGLVENMPDGNAQRPGDIVTSMSGQTIEVINTDAEGRLVLCDAITWTQRTFGPEIIVDLATLTGAMMIALGDQHAGLFANDDDLANGLLAAGLASGDRLWRFPLSEAYDKLIDSPIADMKNVGPRFAGSITAAQFIKRFVDDGVKWAHLDIAGMVWADKPGPLWDKGATGYGVRLLDRFVTDVVEG